MIDQTASPGSGNASLALVAVVLLYVSLQLHGLLEIPVANVAVAPWNFAAVLVLVMGLGAALTGRFTFRMGAASASVSVSYFVLTAWMIVAASYSQQPVAALAVVGVQILNLGVLLLLGGGGLGEEGLFSVNYVLYGLGLIFAAIAFTLFLPALAAYPELPAPEGLGFVLDRGLALRMKGLTRDPNFFAFYTSIPFLIAVAQKRLPGRTLGLLVLGSALALSLSRTLLLAILVAVPAGALLAAFSRAGVGAYVRRVSLAFVLAVVAVSVLVVGSDAFRKFLLLRLTSIGSQSRIPKWLEAWSVMENPFLGEGLRTLNAVLGRFSHNTWLDVFIETGLVGSVAWLWFVGATTVLFVQLRGKESATPWFLVWIVTLIMASAFSLIYHPIFAVLAGLALGCRVREIEEYQEREAGQADPVSFQPEARSAATSRRKAGTKVG